MNNRYSNPISFGNTLEGEHIKLRKIRTDFSQILRDERKLELYNSEGINHYQYHMLMKEIQSLDSGYNHQLRTFEQQGLKLHKVVDVKLNESDKYNVEYVKLLVFRNDDHNNSRVGGIHDGLSVSLGYLPSDNELTITEVKFRKYIK